jgi:predicted phage-related endonuclease
MSKHSDDFSTYDEIKEVLEDPLIITQSEQKENRTLYYKYNTSTSNFSTVVVEDNSIECFVVTAYKTNNSKVKLFPPIYYAKVEPYIKKEGETNENT